jgi:hypothetical protein
MMGIGAMVPAACDEGRLEGEEMGKRTRARKMSDGRETSDVNMSLGIFYEARLTTVLIYVLPSFVAWSGVESSKARHAVR